MIEQMKTKGLSATGGADIIHTIPKGAWTLQSVYAEYVDDFDSCIVRFEIRTPQITGYWLVNNILLYDENNNMTFPCNLRVNGGDEVIARFSSGTALKRVRSTMHIARVVQ